MGSRVATNRFVATGHELARCYKSFVGVIILFVPTNLIFSCENQGRVAHLFLKIGFYLPLKMFLQQCGGQTIMGNHLALLWQDLMKMATTIPNYLHAMMDYYRNNLEHKEPKLRTSTNKCCTDVADRSVLKKNEENTVSAKCCHRGSWRIEIAIVASFRIQLIFKITYIKQYKQGQMFVILYCKKRL